MIEIKDLLTSFNKILQNEDFKINAIIEVLFKYLNIKIDKGDIKIKNSSLYLNIKPIYKNEILIKKAQILKDLELILGKQSPKDFK